MTESSSELNPSLDRGGLLGIAAVTGILLSMVLAAGLRIVLTDTGAPAWVSGIAFLVAFLLVRITVGQLRGALGVRMDPQGIRGAGSSKMLAWSALDTVERGEFGRWVLRAGSDSRHLSTYLFQNRAAIEQQIEAWISASGSKALDEPASEDGSASD